MKIYRPRPDTARQDPYALRYAALLLLALGLGIAQHDAPHRLMHGLRPDMRLQLRIDAAVDAWIEPPAYTNAATVFLKSTQMSVAGAKDGVTVPENSLLKVRLSGFRFAPRVSLNGEKQKLAEAASRNYTAEIPLTKSGHLRLSYFMIPLASGWDISVAPDQPPSLKLLMGTPANQGALKISYQAKDDYGVRKITGRITTPDGRGDIEFDIPPTAAEKDVMSHTEDLSWHPLAGSYVDLTLIAEDDAGHKAVSNTEHVLLPERNFTNAAAQKLAFERKRLMLHNNPITRILSVGQLAEVANHPAWYRGDTRVFLPLAVAIKRLAYGGSDQKAVDTVIPLLWDIALRIEDGGLSTATRDLSEALQKLKEMLKDKNASKQEIQQMMAEVQKKMREYLQSLASEMQQRMNMAQQSGLPPEIAEKIMQQMDLGQMIQQMQQLMQGNSREQMEKMAEALQNSLRNIDPSRMQQMQERQKKSIEALNALNEIIKGQQSTLDKTNKLQQGEKDGETQGQQQQLRQKLGDLMRKIADLTGGEIPEEFTKADQAMKKANENLKSGDNRGAGQAQKDALEALQQGMDNATKQAAQAMQQMMSLGFMGEGSYGEGSDPLGRQPPQGQTGDIEIPEERERRRVQEIIRELRQRSNDYQRPKVERDYIDRLLDTFN